MNNSESKENVIATDRRSRHDIRRYEFKAMETFTSDDSSNNIAAAPLLDEIEQQHEEQGAHEQAEAPAMPPPQVISGIEAELIERLLEKSDGLEKTLAAVQQKLDKQQEEMEKILREAKEESRQQGIKEGQELAKTQMQEEINTQLQAFGDSIAQIGETSQKVEEQINNIEKDLSLIAIDIAKEIIAKEVSSESSEIALTLSKKLLESLKEATKILIKLNPQDYALLLKRFDGDGRIKLQADKAIARGGVVVISDSGNLDGTIMSRFENLKRSILEGRSS
ncbi:MAG: flagellar assembly protein FliH [Helicobacter sp.]|nr:flagellar assembly protein FliH [Helicobacter sp.]MDE6044683.1 flagellar assembly protein FliH [Helicobacter sp.]MDE7195550.1 flagellar assembly protein FliH [Helicobacter sp.]